MVNIWGEIILPPSYLFSFFVVIRLYFLESTLISSLLKWLFVPMVEASGNGVQRGSYVVLGVVVRRLSIQK